MIHIVIHWQLSLRGLLADEDIKTPITISNKIYTEFDVTQDIASALSTYDSNTNGTVDNAELVNGLTVETAVPINALFTDTKLTDAQVKTAYEANVDTNALTDNMKTLLETKKVKNVSLDPIGNNCVVTYTDDTVALLNVNDIVTDIHVDGASLDASSNVLTLTSAEGGADVVVDLSDFVNSSELVSALAPKMDKIASTDNSITRFDGLGGAVQNSSATIDDAGNMVLGGSIVAEDSITLSGLEPSIGMLSTISGKRFDMITTETELTFDNNVGDTVLSIDNVTGAMATSSTINGRDIAADGLVLDSKQDKLVTQVNIKSVNGESLLGTGDIVISGGSDVSDQIGVTIQGYDVDTVIDADYVATEESYTTVEKARLATMEDNATADQLAVDVPVVATGNLTSTDAQSALVELQTDIDVLNDITVGSDSNSYLADGIQTVFTTTFDLSPNTTLVFSGLQDSLTLTTSGYSVGANDITFTIAPVAGHYITIVSFAGAFNGGSGVSAWGSVTGILANQTDLQSELDTKQAILPEGAFTSGDKNKLDNITDNFKGYFADAVERDATITSPAVGFYVIQADTNSLWYYDGAVWINTGSTATGDMLSSIYDPSGRATNVYNTDNHISGTTNKVYTVVEQVKVATLDSSGSGTSYLSDDGTYKVIDTLSNIEGGSASTIYLTTQSINGGNA